MVNWLTGVVVAALVAMAAGGPAMAAAGTESSGLPLPRFVSLRSEQVNMRTGPGVRYPIEWVYLRRELPVEVIQEFETWRKIRDPQGAEGWVHQSMLSGRRTLMTLTGAPLLRDPNSAAGVIADLEPGVQAHLIQCPRDSAFCKVEVQGRDGWLARDAFWGVYRNEYVD